MMNNPKDGNKILVSTEGPVTRGTTRELDVDILQKNINLFLVQIEKVMETTPETVGKFQFTEFEVHANVSAEGQLVLLGSGGKSGVQGGLKFKFQKIQVPVEKEKVGRL